MKEACPYLQERRNLGLDCEMPLGPDWANMHAYQAARLVAGVQQRSDGFAVSRRKLVPYDLTPDLHALLAEANDSTLASHVQLADDLDFAIRTIVSCGSDIRAWRQRQWRVLLAHLRRLRPLATIFSKMRTVSARRVSGHLAPAYLCGVCHSISWPDMAAAMDLCKGVQIVGSLPTFGIYRSVPAETSDPTASSAHKSNRQWLDELMLRKPPTAEEAAMVFEKSEKERQLGILEGWFSAEDLHKRFGRYQWRHMIRFATWQENHAAFRCIDNAKSSEHNLRTAAEERIHTTSVDMGLAICQRFRRLLDMPLKGRLSLQSPTKDMKRAYRQIPAREEDLRFSVISLWHPCLKKWVFGVLHGLALGLLAAVLQFNRYPAALVAVARRWLAIAIINFFDDFKITEPSFAAGSGGLYFDKLVSELGWLFDVDKDKPFRWVAAFLGGLETYLPDCVKLQPTPQREEVVIGMLRQAISEQKLKPRDALRLSGKLIHLAFFLTGRVGRGQTHALEAHGLGVSASLPRSVLRCLQFHLALLELKPYRQVSLIPNDLPQRYIYTDASCESCPPLRLPVVQVAWIVLGTVNGVAEAGFTVLPDAVIQSFEERSTYIAQGEAFGPLLGVHFHSQVLGRSHNIFFIDNLGVLSALVVGRARVADFGTIIHAFHLSLAHLGSTAWFEHVESGANPSDGGSRAGAACPVAKRLNVVLLEHQFPPWPGNVLHASPQDWLAFLNSAS